MIVLKLNLNLLILNTFNYFNNMSEIPIQPTTNPPKITGKLVLQRKIRQTEILDNIVLTTKQIICEFQFLIACTDMQDIETHHNGIGNENANRNVDNNNSKGYINLCEQNKQYLDLCIKEDSTANEILFQCHKHLNDWHKQITKVSIDYDTAKHYYNPDHLTKFKDHFCQYLPSDIDYSAFSQMSHLVVSVNVYFHLTKNITNVGNYGVNYKYLHKLLSDKLRESDYFRHLDECNIPTKYVQYNHDESDEIIDETIATVNIKTPIYFVKPTIKLIPLLKY